MTREVTLTLPEPLADQAEEAGLLTSEGLERLLREEIRRQKINRLFAAADRLAGQDGAALTPEEVEVEVQAVRGQRHGERANGG